MNHRRLVLIALLVAGLLAASIFASAAALAGEYPVYACEPAHGDVNHSWLRESNNAKMAEYTNCPVPWTETRVWNQGLVTRASVPSGGGTGSVGALSYGALRLRAPAGAGLSRITFQHSLCGYDGFKAGLVDAANQWLVYSGPNFCGTLIPSPWTTNLNGTPSVALMTICAQASCRLTSPLHAWASMRSATVWVSDSTRPSVAITGGSMVAPGWHRGVQSVGVAAHDNVGIRHVGVYLDGDAARGRSGICDWTAVIPCSTPLSSLFVDSNRFTDGAHTLRVMVSDSAGNVASTTRRVWTDNTPPTGPIGLRAVGGDAWRSANRFDVAWTNPPQGRAAPVSRVRYAICPATNRVDDFAHCSREVRLRSGDEVIRGAAAPGPGDWVVRVWLEDAAGNQDRRTAQSVHLRYDDEPPTIRLLASDPADPQRIAVAASDSLAGVAGVEVEIRREGQPAWLSLPVARAGNGIFSAQVDDAAIPAGRYDVRARARDIAGNERSTGSSAAGLMTLDLPVRVRTALAVGRPRRRGRHPAREVLIRSATVRFGQRLRLRGQLTLPGRNPLAFADVDIFQQTALPGQPWRRVGVVRTDHDGHFGYKTTLGPSRTLRFTYGGTKLVQPRSGYVRLRVRAATSFRVNRQQVVNGDDVVFSGRVRGRLPSSGKLIQLQAYSRGTWRTFATPRASARSHRWHYDYRFSATRGLVRYRFRAVVPREAGFPYARGTSRRIHVTVRGL